MYYFSSLLHRAAYAISAAVDASRAWQDGGDPDLVADTAWNADEATAEAVAALAYIDAALGPDTYPETRAGRLVMAARLLVLAGTDEGGQSDELEIAAAILKLAVHL